MARQKLFRDENALPSSYRYLGVESLGLGQIRARCRGLRRAFSFDGSIPICGWQLRVGLLQRKTAGYVFLFGMEDNNIIGIRVGHFHQVIYLLAVRKRASDGKLLSGAIWDPNNGGSLGTRLELVKTCRLAARNIAIALFKLSYTHNIHMVRSLC